MKSYKNFDKKVEDFFDDGYAQSLVDKFIFKDHSGVYHLYGRYYIIPVKSTKTFNIHVRGTHTSKSFYTLKNAVAWCIADKRFKFVESNRIEQLDKDIFRIETSLHLYEKLIKKVKDVDQKLIYLAKSSHEKTKKKNIKIELTKLISNMDAWQLAQFNNENSSKKINTL